VPERRYCYLTGGKKEEKERKREGKKKKGKKTKRAKLRNKGGFWISSAQDSAACQSWAGTVLVPLAPGPGSGECLLFRKRFDLFCFVFSICTY